MPSPSQDTVACTCPSCGNLFAVETSFLGRQVTCPICSAPVTARKEGEAAAPAPEEKPSRATEEQAPATPARKPELEHSLPQNTAQPEEKSPSSASSPVLAPQKKADRRSITVPGAPAPAEHTTKIRKRKEQGNAAPAITTARNASLAQAEPEYKPTAMEAARTERRPNWHIWLFITGLVLASLGVFMFLRGRDMEAESSKILNISDRFVDHEADFSPEVNKDLLRELQQKEQQYRLAVRSRSGDDREAEAVSAHITAAMNELALYCMAKSDEERLNYVMDPAATRPKMKKWAAYGQYKDYLPQEAGKSSKNGDLLQISVLMDDNTMHPAVFLYDRDSAKWKLDWEAWEGYSPMVPAELEAKRPSAPVPVRIALSMSGLYQAPFLEESSAESYRNTAYVSFSLEFPNGERLNAYVDRYSPLALELTKLLYNGPVRACVLIRYPADLPGNQSVIIDRLLYSGWMSDATRSLLPTAN